MYLAGGVRRHARIHAVLYMTGHVRCLTVSCMNRYGSGDAWLPKCPDCYL